MLPWFACREDALQLQHELRNGCRTAKWVQDALAVGPVPYLPQVAVLKALRARRAPGLDGSGLVLVEPGLRARRAVWSDLGPAPGARSILSLDLGRCSCGKLSEACPPSLRWWRGASVGAGLVLAGGPTASLLGLVEVPGPGGDAVRGEIIQR